MAQEDPFGEAGPIILGGFNEETQDQLRLDIDSLTYEVEELKEVIDNLRSIIFTSLPSPSRPAPLAPAQPQGPAPPDTWGTYKIDQHDNWVKTHKVMQDFGIKNPESYLIPEPKVAYDDKAE